MQEEEKKYRAIIATTLPEGGVCPGIAAIAKSAEPRGQLATDLQITRWKLLYTFQPLLLGFNATIYQSSLNTRF